MNDLLLKFADQEEAYFVFEQAGITILDENNKVVVVQYTLDYGLDLIGEIPTIPNSGWCANLRVLNNNIDTTIFEQYLVNPPQPYRVWA